MKFYTTSYNKCTLYIVINSDTNAYTSKMMNTVCDKTVKLEHLARIE